MSRIIFDTATAVNGWIADRDNSLGWLFAVPGSEEADAELGDPHRLARLRKSP